MDIVNDADDGVVDGHKRFAKRHGGFAAAFVVHELAGAGLMRGIGANDRVAL